MRGLCPRLLAVLDLVPTAGAVADIGCDRGHLAIRLATDRRHKVIAIDINPYSVMCLRREVDRLGLSDRIEVRRGDGLALAVDEADVVSVCGLGGDRITAVLAPWRELVPRARFVLQPMTRAAELRRWAAAEGLEIRDERLARYRNRIYQAMLVADGGRPYELSPLAAELGPANLAVRPPLLGDLARQELERWRRVRNPSASDIIDELLPIARPTGTGGQ